MKKSIILMTLAATFIFSSCHEKPVLPPELEQQNKVTVYKYPGFFLLNEGNMGSDKCTLDYYDFTNSEYQRNIYPACNPQAVHGLGDSGSDLKAYGNKLYAVVNGSNLVDIMDLATARSLATVSIPNCRAIAFKDCYAYVSSYASEGIVDIANALGTVYKIDTTTFKTVATCTVGYQPEELAVCGNKLFVANSGGYRYDDGNYDTRVSVIDLNTFKEVKKIEVAPNLFRMAADRLGHIWVSSRGNYTDAPASLSVIDASSEKVIKKLDVDATGMSMAGDSLYIYGYDWKDNSTSFGIIDINTLECVSDKIIKDDTQSDIQSVYCIAVNPESRDIFITDAKDYMTPGMVYCYSREGNLKWAAMTGDIPSRIAFSTMKKKK